MMFDALRNKFFKSKSKHKYFDVHFFEYFPKTKANSLPSSYLLTQSLGHINYTSDVKLDIQTITELNGKNSTLWGIKNENGVYSVEYYFYFKKKYPQNSLEHLEKIFRKYGVYTDFDTTNFEDDYFLISINPHNNEIKGFNIYYALIDERYPVYDIEELGFKTNFSYARECSRYIDLELKTEQKKNTYHAITYASQMNYLLELLFNLCSELFPKEDKSSIFQMWDIPYLTIDIVDKPVHNGLFFPSAVTRKEDCIGLYFVALDIDRFLSFLNYHHYPTSYINEIERRKNRLFHIHFDIGIDFYIQNGEFIVKKTSFYGSI